MSAVAINPVVLRTPAPGRIATVTAGRARLQYGDPLRLLACIAVVGVHVSMHYSEAVVLAGTPQWWYCALWDGAVRWAVPAFVMLSGALLLEPCPGETMSVFYCKRLRRLGPVLLFWPVFYVLWVTFYKHDPQTAGQWAKKLLRGDMYHHLHFLFALPGLYFFTPMLRVYTAHASKTEFRVLTIAIVIITLFSGAIQEYRGVSLDKGYNLFTRFLPFLGFYLTGYALRDLKLGGRGMALAAAGFLASIVLYAVGTAWLFRQFPYNPFGFYFVSQYSLTRFLGGVCVFLLAANLFRHGIWWSALDRVVPWLASASLGIYLIHPVFVEMWQKLNEWPNIWLGVPFTWACAWGASLAVTVVLRQIPYVGRLIG